MEKKQLFAFYYMLQERHLIVLKLVAVVVYIFL